MTGNMTSKVLLVCLIFLTPFRLNAEKTLIDGKAPGAQGCEIRIIAYRDMITFSERVISRTIVDSAGRFQLVADITEITPVILDLDYYTANLILEPGKTYTLDCNPVDISNQYRPFYEKEDLIYRLIPPDTAELNYRISVFNGLYNKFIADHFDEIYLLRRKKLIEDFRLEMEKQFVSDSNTYFKNYLAYKIAQTELSAGSVNKPGLYEKHFGGKPVLYSNSEYMHFFNQFFKGYIAGESKKIRYAGLVHTINDSGNRTELLNLISYDTLLKEERIRELVLLKTLFELYYNPDFLQKSILNLLRDFASTSEFPEHRSVSENMIAKLTNLQRGTAAPDFTLPLITGGKGSLSDFNGKPVYLSFMTTWTFACLAEFDLLDSLYRAFGEKINLITVSLDKNQETLKNYVNDKGFRWTFFFNGTAYDLIHDYGIRTFPLFVLVDAKGKILQYPADKPSEGIDEKLRKLSEEKGF
jgi:peroxiredoxin